MQASAANIPPGSDEYQCVLCSIKRTPSKIYFDKLD